MEYKPRIVDAELAGKLRSTGAVVIEGPKACGKTATARRQAASEVLLDVDANARRAVAIDPGLVLQGEAPRLIDEWQIEPEIWNHVRRTVDDRGVPGQFILTGSAVPADDVTRHSGAARLTRLRMRPMSLFETDQANGEASLRQMLAGGFSGAQETEMSITALAEVLCVGGWPANLVKPLDQSLHATRDYLEEIRRVDVGRVDRTWRDPQRIGRLLRSLARNTATEATINSLAADAGGADGSLARDTVYEYLSALDRLMIVEDQPAWAPHLRSRSILRTSPKRHFVDPSLAIAALRASPPRLLKDLELFGLLFESMVVRDLRIYAQANDGSVYHYRDNTGLEIDAIVETVGGRWAAFEVKMGARYIDEAAKNLLALTSRVDTERCGEPGCLGVIVPSGYSYVREDGVAVVTVGALGP